MRDSLGQESFDEINEKLIAIVKEARRQMAERRPGK
jgi:hypothetical protein